MISALTTEEQKLFDKTFLRLAEVFGKDKFQKLSNWLDENEFLVKCAGAKHHGTNDGDLARHSFEVYNQLAKLTDCNNLIWQREESPLIVGLLHDICKCYNYKKDSNGKWIWNTETLLGHGSLSVSTLVSLVDLTDEEKMCIRYHMGAYEGQEIWGELSNAIKLYPNILWTHQADMIASKFYI